MKIVYIGASDFLAETLVGRLAQEGNEVYLLSDKPLSRQKKGALPHRYYRSPRKGESFEKLLVSIAPECVVFVGNHYMGISSANEADEDVSLLARTLRATESLPGMRFVLLSSTAVYGNTDGPADEGAHRAPVGEQGVRFVREEDLLDVYRSHSDAGTVVLRASQLYSEKPAGGGSPDFVTLAFNAVSQPPRRMVADVFQPLDVSDLADAVKRVVGGGNHPVYNVCGKAQLSARRLYQLACQREGFPEQDIKWDSPAGVVVARSDLIRDELGWRDLHDLEDQLNAGEIVRELPLSRNKDKKKPSVPKAVRQLLENLLVFAVFFALDMLCEPHEMFSQIDWMLIYVILISLFYNVYQGALAAILASVAFLFGQNVNLFEPSTFQSYAGNILEVVQLVFLGLVVSYTTSMLREEVRSNRSNLEELREDYDDLSAINDENVLIKNEYERRLLTSKTGFPKLYDLISRLMVQEPDRIMLETMQVISELMSTDTVAIYQGQAGSPWLRLVGALSDESTMGGKTWNLSSWPRIEDAVAHGELYQGQVGTDEPAVVLPIVCQGVPEAVVLIKRLPYESETLYHVNLLKTLSLLLRDSMEKALQHERLSRDELYVKGTDILKPEAFRKRILLAQEKADKGIADYCVIELVFSGSAKKAAAMVGETIRVTDCMGTDDSKRLFVLLNNTDAESLARVQERLMAYGVQIRSVPVKFVTA